MQYGLRDRTIGMAADNDVQHLQDCHRLFDGGRATALHRTIRRHQVTGVSENTARSGGGLCEMGGVDPGIGIGSKRAGEPNRMKSFLFLPSPPSEN